MNLVPHGLTPHQYGARRTWAQRREKFGASGFSTEGIRQMVRNLTGQNDRRKKAVHQRRCRRGHRYDNPDARRCNTCARMRYHRPRCAAMDAAAVARVRDAMIAVGIKAQRHPESQHYRRELRRLRTLWKRLTSEAA